MYVIQWDSKNGSSGSTWSTKSYCNDKEVLFYTWLCVCLNSCRMFGFHVINIFINLSTKLGNMIVNSIQVLVLGKNQHVWRWHWKLSWIGRLAENLSIWIGLVKLGRVTIVITNWSANFRMLICNLCLWNSENY